MKVIEDIIRSDWVDNWIVISSWTCDDITVATLLFIKPFTQTSSLDIVIVFYSVLKYCFISGTFKWYYRCILYLCV